MPMGDDNGPFAGETAILKEAITPTKINYGYKAMLVTVLVSTTAVKQVLVHERNFQENIAPQFAE